MEELGYILQLISNWSNEQRARARAYLALTKAIALVVIVAYIGLTAVLSHWGATVGASALHLLFAGAAFWMVTTADVLAVAFLAWAGVNGLPNIRIGDIFLAPFRGDIELPDFRAREFIEAGIRGMGVLFRATGHLVIFTGLVAAVAELTPVVNVEFSIKVFSGLVTLGLVSILLYRNAIWYRRFALAIALVHVATGFVGMYSVPDVVGERYAGHKESEAQAEQKLRTDFLAAVAAISRGDKPTPAQNEAIRLMADGYTFQYGTDPVTDRNIKAGLAKLRHEHEDVWYKNICRWASGSSTTRVLKMDTLRDVHKVCDLEPGRYEFRAQTFEVMPVAGPPSRTVAGPGILSNSIPSGGEVFVSPGECQEVRLAEDQGLDLRTPIHRSAIRVYYTPTL